MLGIKYDDNKPRYDLVPWSVFEDSVRVLGFGAKKYEVDNWKKEIGRASCRERVLRLV